MRIVTPDKLIQVGGRHPYHLKPFCRYIISDYELDEFLRGSPHTEWEWSSFHAWERKYAGQDLNGKRLCVYRHNAWGDQLIASAVPRYLKILYPESVIHMYCHPEVMPLWLGNPFVEGSAISLPIPFEAVDPKNPRHYDYSILYEGMLEGNSEPDQHCCYDDFFGVMGVHGVPAKYKRPCIFPRPEDYKCVEKLGLRLDEKYMVYHMSPANLNRSYPPGKSVEFLHLFSKAYPDWLIYIVGLDESGEFAEVWEGRSAFSNIVDLTDKTSSFRDLIPIIENASLVVCPDSAVMHLAACFEKAPVVSLWGLFHPQDRVKYYPNHHAIFHPEACPHAPCRDHNFHLPLENCKDATEHRQKCKIKFCPVLTAIEPEEILAKCKEVL